MIMKINAGLQSILFKFNYKPMWLFLLFYFIINTLFLTKFPFVHSDEFWLSGLSRNIMETGNISVTETFFDLYPRHPHAIKTIFHLVQVFFIKIFNYHIFTIRLISLLCGILSLGCFFRLCLLITNSKKISFASALLLSFDIQFIYASHFARQEIILLFVLLCTLYSFFRHLDTHTLKHDIILAAITGTAIGIHPNSFIIAVTMVSMYFYQIWITKKFRFNNLVFFIMPLSIFALFFIALSFWCDPRFFFHYAAYGDQFGVLDPLISKIQEITLFYLKLFYQISGTYYTPNIKFQFFLFTAIIVLTIIKLACPQDRDQKHQTISILIAIIAVNFSIILIGRYNQTSIVLQFPLFYLLAAYLFKDLKAGLRKASILMIMAILLTNSYQNIFPFLGHDYQRYINEIAKAVPKNIPVLANLNCEPYFSQGKLFDYRNLAFLADHQITFKEYIRKNKIQYIIYPEEMDVIYQERPKWNGLYGSLTYYEDMIDFFHTNCRQVYQFSDPIYGIRIAPYINDKPWKIKIYQVLTWD
ncbi:MAG: glycosyltransferase family 39 protein [Dehalobacterium sp.]